MNENFFSAVPVFFFATLLCCIVFKTPPTERRNNSFRTIILQAALFSSLATTVYTDNQSQNFNESTQQIHPHWHSPTLMLEWYAQPYHTILVRFSDMRFKKAQVSHPLHDNRKTTCGGFNLPALHLHQLELRISFLVSFVRGSTSPAGSLIKFVIVSGTGEASIRHHTIAKERANIWLASNFCSFTPNEWKTIIGHQTGRRKKNQKNMFCRFCFFRRLNEKFSQAKNRKQLQLITRNSGMSARRSNRNHM